MDDSPPRSPVRPDEVERKFAETLREAAWIFEKEKDGRFRGSIMACEAVIGFIKARRGGAELAGPFVRIAEAFAELGRGGKPALFSKKTSALKERARSPERKNVHMTAAVALEVLVKLGEQLNIAAKRVARHVNDWPGMRRQDVTGVTVINWRKQLQRPNNPDGRRVETAVNAVFAERNPRGEIERLLKKGPPGHWQS